MSADKQLHDRHHVMEVRLRRIIRDPDGTIVFDSGDQPSHSFVLSFLKHVWHAMNHPYTAGSGDEGSHPDTGNTARILEGSTAFVFEKYFGCLAPINISTYGIVVGSGSGAESNADYALTTQIAHGVGAGQLQHGAQASTEAIVVGANVDTTWTRTFVNASGGSVDVTEIGMYCTSSDQVATERYFCILRDLLAATDTINNGQTYTVVYTLRTTV